ncbi:MAG: YkvA family protein [Pleomorphochaeta sp.]
MSKLNDWARSLKKQIKIIYFVYLDEAASKWVKILIFITLAYALSPIDLIPDFIPILGYLDDLIILPLMILLVLKLVDSETIDRARQKAEQNESLKLPVSKLGAFFVLLFWCIIFFLIIKSIIK